MATTSKMQFGLQVLLIMVALASGFGILAYSRGIPFNADSQSADSRESIHSDSFDMLAFLDNAIACQEDEKDVRCWSSVNKIQMFLAGAPLTHDAISARIEGYMELIHSIWAQSASASNSTTGGDNPISMRVLVDVLDQRFPHGTEAGSGSMKFTFDDSSQPVLVLAEAMEDYDDTIEPWRLLQTWASRNTNRQGRLTIEPVFSEEALGAFYDFLKGFDIALLNHARQIANEGKKSAIDAESMTKAFGVRH